MACQVKRDDNGNIVEVYAPNGKPSILYKSILQVEPDPESALRLWAQTYTKSFKDWFGDWQSKTNEDIVKLKGKLKQLDKTEKGRMNKFFSEISSGINDSLEDDTSDIEKDRAFLKDLIENETSSRVVDENGEPLLVFHGSNAMFNEFRQTTKRLGEPSAIFFTPNKEYAEEHADRKFEGLDTILYAGFLNIRHLHDLNEDQEEMDHWSALSAILKNSADGVYGVEAIYNHIQSYAVARPGQFKSITNQGTFNSNTDNIYHQLSDEEVEFYGSQLEGKTRVQKEVAEKMLSMQTEITLTSSHEYFMGSEKLDSVTETLKKDPFYAFHGDTLDESKYEMNRQWGNVIDKVLTGVVLGKSLDEIKEDIDTSLITDEALNYVYETMLDVREQYPDSILLSQIILYNRKKRIAGSLDLVVIQPNGKIKIIDLKSSTKSFTKPYTTESGYENRYNKRFKMAGTEYASKADRHQAQLSVYAALAESKGFTLDDNPLAVLPMKLETEGDVIMSVEREKDFIEANYLKNFKNQYAEDFEGIGKEPFAELLDKIKILVEERIQEFKRQKKATNVYFLEILQKKLNDSVNLQAVNAFIEEAHNSFIGTSKWQGWKKRFDSILNRTDNENEDLVDLMENIRNIEAQIEIYMPQGSFNPLQSLLNEYRQHMGDTKPDKDSPMGKLIEVVDAINSMRESFNKTVPGIIAKILTKQISQEAIREIKTNLKAKQDKLAYYKDKGNTKAVNRLEGEINEYKEKYKIDEKGDPNVEKMIEQELRVGGYKDISSLDRWLTPAISLDNSFMATFALTIKQAFEKVRQNAREFIVDANKEFKKFSEGKNIDDPATLNKDLYTIRESVYKDNEGNRQTKNLLVLIAPLDYGAFEKSKMEFYDSLKEIKDPKERNKREKIWYAQNTEARPLKDYKINDVVLIEGMESILRRKKAELDERLYEQWLKENRIEKDGKIIYKGELSIPRRDKYKDARFNTILENEKLKNYYSFLAKTYFESQEQHPSLRRKEKDKYILPFISKSSNDRLRENGFMDYMKHSINDAFTLLDEDQNEYNVESTKTIPILYYNTSRRMDAADVSTDLIHSIIKFRVASLRFKEQNRYASLADNLLSLVKQTKPALTDSSGYKILSRAAKSIGLKNGVDEYVKKHNGNNVAALLEAFIDTQIYGKTRVDERVKVLGKTIDLGKIADTIINFGSITQIGLDASLAVANSLQANAMLATEAVTNKYFTPKEWAEALALYERFEMDFLKDSFSTYRQSLIGQLTDLYEPMQGDYLDDYGHRLSKTALKAKWRQASFFAGMRKGEHHIQVTMMIAMLKKAKVDYVDPETGVRTKISAFEAYELDANDKISLKKGVKGDLLNETIQKQMHAISKRLHGVYNKLDAPDIQRHWWGRLLMMYRKFLVPGIKKRWKGEGFDYELDTFTQGTYRVFYKALLTDFKHLSDALLNKSHAYSEFEIANIRRALMEHAIIITTGTIVYILSAALKGLSDDEKPGMAWTLYFAMRLNSELSLYGGLGDPSSYFLPNIKEMTSVYKSVSAGVGIIDKAVRVYSQGMEDLWHGEFERYQRDTGFFKTGDTKLEANIYKLLGINPRKILENPNEAIDMLILQKGTR